MSVIGRDDHATAWITVRSIVAQTFHSSLETVESRSEGIQQRLESVTAACQRVSELRGPVRHSIDGDNRCSAGETGLQSGSVVVQQAYGARWDVAVVAVVRTDVTATVNVAAKADGILRFTHKLHNANKRRSFVVH